MLVKIKAVDYLNKTSRELAIMDNAALSVGRNQMKMCNLTKSNELVAVFNADTEEFLFYITKY